MDEKITYGASVLLGALALVLLIANVSLVNGNRHLQEDISKRQAAINTGVNLSQLNQGLVQALADASVKGNDAGMRDLLAAQGITVNPNAAAGGQQGAPSGPGAMAPPPPDMSMSPAPKMPKAK